MSSTPRTAALRAMLGAHVPADSTEASHRARLLALLERGEAALARDSFDPGHVTASAFVLSPAADALLLVHHRKLGLWLQPGGHVEPADESILAAARREVAEEVGISELLSPRDGLLDVDIHRIPARGDTPGHEHFDVRCLLQARSLAFAASEAEVKGARWVGRDELEAMNTDESVRRAARKIWGGVALTRT